MIAAGSTGSIPATAELLSVIARLPRRRGRAARPRPRRSTRAPGRAICRAAPARPVLGHPQYGLAGCSPARRRRATRWSTSARPRPRGPRADARRLEALRPAETTDLWVERRAAYTASGVAGAFAGVSLVEAPNERDEARPSRWRCARRVSEPGRTAALVTGDRELARRVAAELLRFGIRADDSGGTPLSSTPPAGLLLRADARGGVPPGDPVAILALLKHPLLRLGMRARAVVRIGAETIELVALRGGTGRPDMADAAGRCSRRGSPRWPATAAPPFWLARRITGAIGAARARCWAGSIDARWRRWRPAGRAMRAASPTPSRATVAALEAARPRRPDGGLERLYAGEAGERLAGVAARRWSRRRRLARASRRSNGRTSSPRWPAPETVKPGQGGDPRIAIWGALEARLQDVDTLVIGGLNEGVWPRRAEADRFMSRMMKTGLELEPPERRIGQAAHDFVMAACTTKVVLTRSARAGDAPAVASRWLQRLLAFARAGPRRSARCARAARLLAWARGDRRGRARRPRRARPEATRRRWRSGPPLLGHRDRDAAPRPLRDLCPPHPRPLSRSTRWCAIRARPNAARCSTTSCTASSLSGVDPRADGRGRAGRHRARAASPQAALPPDVEAVWWPRFERMVPEIVDWERAARRHRPAPSPRCAPTDLGRRQRA